MELRHLYTLSELIKEKVGNQDLPDDILDRMEIKIIFPNVTFYGIDKEFYYLTHNNNYEGFVHSEVVNAKINGVKFKLLPEQQKKAIEEDKAEMI